MRFESPLFLFLLILIPLLYLFFKKQNKPAAIRFSVPIPKHLYANDPSRYSVWIKLAALTLMIIALARPQNSFKQTQRQVSGIDILMVLDLSASMNIEDLSERSRIDIAKRVMEDFIKGRQNDRIGFVVFSGEPLTLAPPTLDYGLVLSSLRSAQTGSLKDGTAIGDGLALAVNRLKDSKAKSRTIVLLTDGESNIGQVDPLTAGDLASGFGIKVYTIAIGREGRVRMPIRQKGVFGNTVTTYQWFDNQLNTDLLQQIAKRTEGKFYRVQDEKALDKVFEEIDQLEKTEVKSTDKTHYEEAYSKILVIALLLMMLDMLLRRLVWKVVTA